MADQFGAAEVTVDNQRILGKLDMKKNTLPTQNCAQNIFMRRFCKEKLRRLETASKIYLYAGNCSIKSSVKPRGQSGNRCVEDKWRTN